MNKGFFKSESELYPWLQVKFSKEKVIQNVTIVNRKDRDGWRLKWVEVRTGMNKVEEDFIGQRINANPVCGNFLGPGEDGGIYNITCKNPIRSKYLTVQITPNITFPDYIPETILQINELIVNVIFS